MFLRSCLEAFAALLRSERRVVQVDGIFEGLADEFQACSLVDREARVVLSASGARRMEAEDDGSSIGMGVVAAGMALLKRIDPQDEIEDILITTRQGIEVLRPLDPDGALFVQLNVARKGASLPAVRQRAREAELAFA